MSSSICVCRQVWKHDLSRYCGTVCNPSLVSLAKPIVVLRQRFVKYTSPLILAIIPLCLFLSFFYDILEEVGDFSWWPLRTWFWFRIIFCACIWPLEWRQLLGIVNQRLQDCVRLKDCKTLYSKISATSKCLLGFLNVYKRFLSVEEDSLRPCQMSNFKLTSPR